MDDAKTLERMREDWNQRAGEDANYYVAFGRREQELEEFFATATDVVRLLEHELRRLEARGAALEIGCGPGRLMRPLSGHFDEIHGIDISDEMIRLAKERLRGTPNAFPQHASGADLAQFRDETFDFVYSYAVFQHIPSRDVVFNYLREARRVLKTGGILRCQLNGLPKSARQYDTWSGVRIGADEIAEFAGAQDFQLLALEQIWTQYMWITCRKRAPGWLDGAGAAEKASSIRNITNAQTGESAVPAQGAMAALSLWIAGLPERCDLNHMSVTADSTACRMTYIGHPEHDGVTQVNAALPEGIRTGLVPVDARWFGRSLAAPGWVRIIPPGPLVPQILAVTDGVNLVAGTRISSGIGKAVMADVPRAEEFRALVDGIEARGVESFCVDPVARRYEFNFRLPEGIGRGRHEVRILLGQRVFAPLAVEVA